MSEGCAICGERDYLYYEGYDYPDWKNEHYTDRDRPVGEYFCSVEHLVQWLSEQGFEIPDVHKKTTEGDTE